VGSRAAQHIADRGGDQIGFVSVEVVTGSSGDDMAAVGRERGQFFVQAVPAAPVLRHRGAGGPAAGQHDQGRVAQRSPGQRLVGRGQPFERPEFPRHGPPVGTAADPPGNDHEHRQRRGLEQPDPPAQGTAKDLLLRLVGGIDQDHPGDFRGPEPGERTDADAAVGVADQDDRPADVGRVKDAVQIPGDLGRRPSVHGAAARAVGGPVVGHHGGLRSEGLRDGPPGLRAAAQGRLDDHGRPSAAEHGDADPVRADVDLGSPAVHVLSRLAEQS
jgi:hypothetical protein